MSNPSFSNIDLWLFELYEGNLSLKQIAELEVFLLQHPELEIDLDMWKLSYVHPTPLVYPHQNKLEKRRPVALYWSAGIASLMIGIIGGTIFFNDRSAERTHVVSSSALNREHQQSFKLSTYDNTNIFDKHIINKNLQFNEVTNDVPPESVNTIHAINPSLLEALPISTNNETTWSNSSLQEIKKVEYVSEVGVGELKIRGFQLDHFPNTSMSLVFNNVATSELKEIEDWTLHRTSANYKSNKFSSKLKDFKRAIQKMADNPIALKNLKDPHYHVPGLQAVEVNFGAVGTLLATRVQTNSRYQWLGQLNDQLTNNLLIDGYVYPIRGGIGIQVNQSTYHKNGYQNTFAAITYSPKFSVSKNVTIEPALRFKMGNQRIQPSKLTLGQLVEFERGNVEQFYSANEIPTGKALWYKDLGLSVMVNTKWFYVGAQIDNLGKHQSNIYGAAGQQRAGIHSIFTVGTDYQSKNKKIGFSPYLIYQNYDKLSEAWLGANFRASWFTVGAAISSNTEPAASVGVKFKHFAIIYNTDYTKSMMTSKPALSHQLTLRFLTNPSRVGQRLLNY